jgi:hypothetical protein
MIERLTWSHHNFHAITRAYDGHVFICPQAIYAMLCACNDRMRLVWWGPSDWMLSHRHGPCIPRFKKVVQERYRDEHREDGFCDSRQHSVEGLFSSVAHSLLSRRLLCLFAKATIRLSGQIRQTFGELSPTGASSSTGATRPTDSTSRCFLLPPRRRRLRRAKNTVHISVTRSTYTPSQSDQALQTAISPPSPSMAAASNTPSLATPASVADPVAEPSSATTGTTANAGVEKPPDEGSKLKTFLGVLRRYGCTPHTLCTAVDHGTTGSLACPTLPQCAFPSQPNC